MSTLCEPGALEDVEPQATDTVWSFQYPRIAPAEFSSAREAGHVDREIRMQRSQAAALEASRQSGVREGEARAEAALAQKLACEREAITQALEQFAEERRSYFHQVEKDVVTLALAIARKLLHREAQVDPLLLSGIVRVALEQIQAGSQVVLRTSPQEQEAWKMFLNSFTEKKLEATVLADESVASGRLLLETSAGTAEVSLEDKLKEIESGFLDLLRSEESEFHGRPTVPIS